MQNYPLVHGLPNDVWLEIFTHLPVLSLISCSSVSRTFCRIADTESLWKNLTQSMGWYCVCSIIMSHLQSKRSPVKENFIYKLKTALEQKDSAPLSGFAWFSSFFSHSTTPKKTLRFTLNEQNQSIHKYKCIFLGGTSAGKTSAIYRIVNDRFQRNLSTIGYEMIIRCFNKFF
jgi:hypothetical protein